MGGREDCKEVAARISEPSWYAKGYHDEERCRRVAANQPQTRCGDIPYRKASQ